jgi:hypothetical protein
MIRRAWCLLSQKDGSRGNRGRLSTISLFNSDNMLDHIQRKKIWFKNKFNYICNILYYYIPINKIFFILLMSYLYDIGCPRSMIPTHGATRSSIPLCPLLMSTHGVPFTMTDGTMYFILYLVEDTWIIHIIVVTLLHIIYLITKMLLLLYSLSHLLHGHIRYIVRPLIHRPLRRVK